MNLRKFFKQSVSFFLIPIIRWYLRKERQYQYKGILVNVLPGIFHPGLFPSTGFLLHHIENQNLKGKTLLELGCGTGLISVIAAKQGAVVTACDLNEKAVATGLQNANLNKVSVAVFQSDLFQSIPAQAFDWIVINPPYYAKPAHNDEELAWNCGENFEYFRKLFSTLGAYIHRDSTVIMVLTLGCDISSIQKIGSEFNFVFDLIAEQNVLFDGKDFLFRISRTKG